MQNNLISFYFHRFMKRCREATTEDPKAKHYVNILMSSVEYTTFIQLMRIMRPVAEARLSLNAESKDSPRERGAGGSKGGAGGDKDGDDDFEMQPLSGKAEGKDAEGDDDYAKSSAGDDKGSK
jgi:hypothetical protein